MFRTTHEQQAYELGCEHARNAASWIIDGNTSQDHVARMVAWLDAGDPGFYDNLPHMPNLSGEWSDGATPQSLYDEITGRDHHARISEDEDADGEIISALADAYEAGVADTFEAECERILRAALDES